MRQVFGALFAVIQKGCLCGSETEIFSNLNHFGSDRVSDKSDQIVNLGLSTSQSTQVSSVHIILGDAPGTSKPS